MLSTEELANLLIIGGTNEPPVIPTLRWFELGVVEWTFAVAPRHALANADSILPCIFSGCRIFCRIHQNPADHADARAHRRRGLRHVPDQPGTP
jgi:hypothetical protein